MRRLLLFLSLAAGLASAECIPFDKAPEHLGETKCVTGKVVDVSEGRSGTLFLNFCEDWRSCAFSVVVFPKNLRDVGDVRSLKGKTIEIEGKIKDYRGRAEIVLEDIKQLRGESAKLPPLPKDYDAEKRGNFSAGQMPRKKN